VIWYNSQEDGHLGPPPAQAGHCVAPSEQVDPRKEAGHFNQPALCVNIAAPTEQALLLDPLGVNRVKVDNSAGFAGDDVNESLTVCMAPCEGTCS
jgi:hypothetical protein